ncbi:hypothetical protein [Natronobacterium gregoryi]|uniref:Uncharacterized protein n=2 Tax=Natronobacterium gregoryi TaxID=44930 RepID=L0ALJ6_NATGS|nr:hypothetical protein [Natronobacterium gregoryi]AFZ74646.1 hypothetical protein Natgr_3528 [Natronobacterium gregoryi SP2]ELY72537.1 hypothetical protein C490_03073 [Natronobacterium gregoryi SP2]PLK19827.1 hypothetical protein CYV19_13040 [Natronobacterium gregoryi SP2]SFJ31233.1 hypothetical protein SAMN05443661_12165 [Natronobacterium gregoryi]
MARTTKLDKYHDKRSYLQVLNAIHECDGSASKSFLRDNTADDINGQQIRNRLKNLQQDGLVELKQEESNTGEGNPYVANLTDESVRLISEGLLFETKSELEQETTVEDLQEELQEERQRRRSTEERVDELEETLIRYSAALVALQKIIADENDISREEINQRREVEIQKRIEN